MDHLAFYKRNESLKDQISGIRISNLRPYTAYFLQDEASINRCMVQISDKVLLYYFAETLNAEDKQVLSKLKQYQNLSVVLCSQADNALDAWRMPVFHFESYPVTGEKVKFAYNKWTEMDTDDGHEEIFKTDEGITRIKHNDIAYIQAAGNYSMVHYKSDKCLVLTRQLGTFAGLCDQDPVFQRLHRSLILNMKNIVNCHNNRIFFKGITKPLEVSPMLESKVKGLLL